MSRRFLIAVAGAVFAATVVVSTAGVAGAATASPPGSPTGSLDTVARVPAGGRIAGWALDRDTPEPIQVHLYANNVAIGAFTASSARPDVGAAFPAHGEAHGFDVTVPLGPGTYQLCAFAINVGPGENSTLGCRSLTVSEKPFGAFDPVGLIPGGIQVSGWAIDPDTESAIAVHLYVDGQAAGAVTAAETRPRPTPPFPGYGDAHFFSAALALAAGNHRVCAFAIDAQRPEVNTVLGCAAVTVGRSPVGRIDGMLRGPGGVRVNGWALDPDSSAAVEVHVYAGATFVASTLASVDRVDIGRAFPAYGAAHGLDLLVPLSAGQTRLCVYAIDVSGQPNALLGCGTISSDSGVRGQADAIEAIPGGVRVAGWALDLDVTDAVTVHVYANASFLGSFTAADARSDVGSRYPGYGDNHGFDRTFALPPGSHRVCAYAINAGAGSGNPSLGCATVSPTA